MRTFTASEAESRFDEVLELAQHEPVRVMRADRVLGVMVSAGDYEAMQAFHADRLICTMTAASDEAAAAGLTEALLDEVLADES